MNEHEEDPNQLIAALCENALELRNGLAGVRVEIGVVRSEMIDCEPPGLDNDNRGLLERSALERLLRWCVDHDFVLTAHPENRHVRISYLPPVTQSDATALSSNADTEDADAAEESGPMIVLRVAKNA
jgi:hypothetical protein